MALRGDYERIGDLVSLCAKTMRMLSANKRARGIDCPFRPASYELEALSREIKRIAADLSGEWDDETQTTLHS